jgi:hypothetical protein
MPVNRSADVDDENETEDPDEDELDDDVVDGASRPRTVLVAPPKPSRRGLKITLLTVVTLVVVIVAIVVVTSGSSGKKSSGSNPKTAKPASTPGLVNFVDHTDGIGLSYPKGWIVEKPKPADSTIALQLDFNNNDPLDTLRVRILPIQPNINVNNLGDIEQFTNSILSGTHITVLEQKAFTTKVGNIPGYWYLYYLQPFDAVPGNPKTQITLVHSHFFVFPANQHPVELLFQTVEKDFSGLSASFDSVLGSFHTVAKA